MEWPPDDEPEGYDTAQVCPNGHPANSSVQNLPQFNKDYCEECGEQTLTACPECGADIRGSYWGGGIDITPYEPPAFCHACGSAFPWTERRIQAAFELATEVGTLSREEAEEFHESVREIARETPRTQVAAHRVRRVLTKLGGEVASGVRDILVEIASETAKKIIWPDG